MHCGLVEATFSIVFQSGAAGRSKCHRVSWPTGTLISVFLRALVCFVVCCSVCVAVSAFCCSRIAVVCAFPLRACISFPACFHCLYANITSYVFGDLLWAWRNCAERLNIIYTCVCVCFDVHKMLYWFCTLHVVALSANLTAVGVSLCLSILSFYLLHIWQLG